MAANPRFMVLSGLAGTDLLGRPAADLIIPQDRPQFTAALADPAVASLTANLDAAHGEAVRVDILISRTAKGAPAMLAFRDRRDLESAQARVRHLVAHDPLTDLPNRAYFQRKVAGLLDYARDNSEPLAILRIDIDHFNRINTSHGHMVGDAALRQIAERISALAGPDDLVARLGGDEFVLLCPRLTGPGMIEVLARNLIEVSATPLKIMGLPNPLPVTVSIGVSFHPHDDHHNHDPLDNAQLALDRAKAEGRNTFRIYTASMGAAASLRRILRRDLGAAIGSPALTMTYQPLVDVASRQTVGFEALARWTHPELGVISPAVFIPLAEEEGLIGRLGEWILRHVAHEAANWPNPLNIAVNLSPIQIYEGDLPALVATVLAETGLAPERLELEITEGVLLDDRDRALAVLSRLKALGVRIAMDDFGTGYSSLHYLQSFPFDKVKIDRSFITDMNVNHHARAIVRAVIGLCQSISVPVVAEGVETDEQLRLLAALSCDQVQGYLTGRPRAAAQLFQLTGAKADS